MRGDLNSGMMRRMAAIAVCVALGATILALTAIGGAQAGGVFLYETGTPDMFTAGAGWAARAQDAATVLANPAGMSRLKGGDLLIGAGALYGDVQFTPSASTTVEGGDGGVAVGWLPNGGAYYARQLSERFSFGLAATSNFGLAESYDPGWVGRYYVEKATLIGISFLPSVAYRVNPTLSFGASLNAMYGVLRDDVAINRITPDGPDGHLGLSTDDLGFGGNFGALWEPSEKTRVGVTYTSPVKLDFMDKPEFTDLGPLTEAALGAAGLLGNDLGVGVTVPQTVMASFYSDLSADWALMGDIGWQDWSQFGKVDVLVATEAPKSLTADLSYKDTWRGAFGVKRRLGDAWLLSAGVGYDSPAVNDADRSLSLPVGAAWRFAIGAQRHLSEKFEIGFGYTFLSMGSMPVDQNRGPLAGRVAGTYENAAIHVLSLQGHWKL
jgi:long-chain fatty acid transport protein